MLGVRRTILAVSGLLPTVGFVGAEVAMDKIAAREVVESQAMESELDNGLNSSFQRWNLRETILKDFQEGRMTMAEAVSRYMQINQSDPQSLFFLRMNFEGKNDFEKTERQFSQHIKCDTLSNSHSKNVISNVNHPAFHRDH